MITLVKIKLMKIIQMKYLVQNNVIATIKQKIKIKLILKF